MSGSSYDVSIQYGSSSFHAAIIAVVGHQVREEGHAGRPGWLGLAQVPGGVVLYGTPDTPHLQAQLVLNVRWYFTEGVIYCASL